VEALLSGLGSYPGYFLRLRDVNRAGPRVYGIDTPHLAKLEVTDVDEVLAAGGAIIDVRPVAAFAAAHVPGALSIELGNSFATWLGWLIDDPATPLVFVLDDHQDRDDLVRRCLGIGYEHLAGELVDYAGATASTTLLDRPVDGAALLDVRQASEWRQGHVPGAHHIELGSLAQRVADVPAGPVVTHCMHGTRSMAAASVLERAGRSDVSVFTGGPDQWAG
jgi:hydroxyacylglutathione hydrolase